MFLSVKDTVGGGTKVLDIHCKGIGKVSDNAECSCQEISYWNGSVVN